MDVGVCARVDVWGETAKYSQGNENLGQGETVFEGTATRFPREIKELCTEGF